MFIPSTSTSFYDKQECFKIKQRGYMKIKEQLKVSKNAVLVRTKILYIPEITLGFMLFFLSYHKPEATGFS